MRMTYSDVRSPLTLSRSLHETRKCISNVLVLMSGKKSEYLSFGFLKETVVSNFLSYRVQHLVWDVCFLLLLTFTFGFTHLRDSPHDIWT